ncbi:hypothetical protein Anapl_01708, partial [Anas platyrhynchos]
GMQKRVPAAPSCGKPRVPAAGGKPAENLLRNSKREQK